jgi:hypothetical protein
MTGAKSSAHGQEVDVAHRLPPPPVAPGHLEPLQPRGLAQVGQER